MKRLNLMFLIIGVAIIFSGCSKDNSLAPLNQNDQETNLKKAKVKRTFEGICTFVAPVPNTWYDATDDWRTTGTTIWLMEQEELYIWGTAELFVDAKNPHDENRGKWDIAWTGTITPNVDGMVIVATGVGNGVEGKVKGMVGHWTYTMNYVGFDFPNPENPTFFYTIEGNIEKPKGPIKK